MTALETMLSDFFKTPVRGEQLLGRWLTIEPRDRTRIGNRLGSNQKLGVNTVIGMRAWDQMGKIRLNVALPTLVSLREFLPPGKAYGEINRITRLHLQQDLDIDLRLTIAPGQKSGTRLGRSGNARLAWTSWLNGGKSRPDNDPVRLRLPSLHPNNQSNL
jgi:type VI secretion system protein ImpH